MSATDRRIIRSNNTGVTVNGWKLTWGEHRNLFYAWKGSDMETFKSGDDAMTFALAH